MSDATTVGALMPHYRKGDLVCFKNDMTKKRMRVWALPRIAGWPEYDIEVGRNGGILVASVDLEPAVGLG